jgi:hypothetical protein
MADPDSGVQLIRGFHQIEHNSWRWSERTFSVILKRPAGAESKGANVVAKLNVPEPVIQRLGPITLKASLQGRTLGITTWTRSDEYTFQAEIPSQAFAADHVIVEFTLDKYLPAGTADSRELGVIINSIGLESH